MKISNIKSHFVVKNKRVSLYCETLKKVCTTNNLKVTASFTIVRLHRFVYTCFFSGFINLTGLQNFEQIEEGIQCLAKYLHMKRRHFEKIKVDSISASYPEPSLIPKQNVARVIKEAYTFNCVRSIKFNRERFPAAFIKTNYGTVLWFGTPSIVVVGSKSEYDLKCVQLFIEKVIRASKAD